MYMYQVTTQRTGKSEVSEGTYATMTQAEQRAHIVKQRLGDRVIVRIHKYERLAVVRIDHDPKAQLDALKQQIGDREIYLLQRPPNERMQSAFHKANVKDLQTIEQLENEIKGARP